MIVKVGHGEQWLRLPLLEMSEDLGGVDDAGRGREDRGGDC